MENIDLYSSIELAKQRKTAADMAKHQASAEDYAAQGFDSEMIYELLCIDGCEKEASRNLSKQAVSDLPYNYTEGSVPSSFFDLEKKITSSLKNAPIEQIEEYFCVHCNNKFAGIVDRIKLARDNSSSYDFQELAKWLKPYVDDIVISNKILSEASNIAIDEKQILEQELFGIWPPQTISKYAEKELGDKKLLKRATKFKGNVRKILFG